MVKATVSPLTNFISRTAMLFVYSKTRITIAVIITHHNYEQYLDEAIQSVINQNTTPDEIIVVDDKPQTETAKNITQKYASFVKYHRVDFGDPLKSREYGFQQTQSKYVCFLDADDIMDCNYLQGAIAPIVTDKANLVFSDINYFRDGRIGRIDITRTNYNPNIPKKRISQTNFLHIGCITERSIIESADAFNHGHLNAQYHEDWMYWRKILETKCKFVKQNCPYFARRHNNNRSTELQKKNKYYDLRGIDLSSITYVGLIEDELSDLYCFSDWCNGIQNNVVHRFYAQLFGNTNLIQPKPNTSWYSIQNKKSIVNQIAKSAITDYVFFYHENKRPEYGKLQSMLRYLDHDVAMIHDSNFELFECTLVVTDILRDYYYHDLEQLPFDDENEKVIYL